MEPKSSKKTAWKNSALPVLGFQKFQIKCSFKRGNKPEAERYSIRFDEYNSSFVFISMTKSLDFWNAVFDDDPSLALLMEVNDFEREAGREAELRNLVDASAVEPSLIKNDSALEKVKWKMPQDLCRQ